MPALASPDEDRSHRAARRDEIAQISYGMVFAPDAWPEEDEDMDVLTDAQPADARDGLEMPGPCPVDPAEEDATSGSLQGILTGVIAGGAIWVGLLATF